MKTKRQVIFYVILASVLVAAAVVTATILAGCSNPSGSSTSKETPDTETPGKETPGTETPGKETPNTETPGKETPSTETPNKETPRGTVAITLDLGGGLGLSEAGGTIYRDREPSRLELKVSGEGWESLDWHVDGRSVADWKGLAAVTIDAEDLSEARHTVALTGVRRSVSYATAVPVTITREWPAVTWTYTAKNSSSTVFDLADWQVGGSTDTWSLSVIEQGVVYFAVRKPPNAVITVQNMEGAAVSKASPGETVDGSFADDLLDLFTVKPAGDAVFGGDECRFELAVSEPDKKLKTVNVTVALRPNLTGVAIFHRGADGSLTRITSGNAMDHANTLYAQHKAGGIPTWGIDFVNVINLSTALKWLDNYALGGTVGAWAEYLVRVEEDEAMPKTLLTGRLNDTTPLAKYIRIRIRGYGGERTITHDSTNLDRATAEKGGGSNMNANQGFLSIGPTTDSAYTPNHLAVHLEKNITIDAASGTNQYFPNRSTGPLISSMIAISRGNTLVMEAGSKLTNYKSLETGYNCTAVDIRPDGAFEWRGGEISNIKGAGNIVLCNDGAGSGGIPAGEFYYYGAGVMSGNTADKIAVGNYYDPILYDVTDLRFAP
jgi:hypothetical protein